MDLTALLAMPAVAALVAVLAAVAAALIVTAVVALVVRLIARRQEWAAQLVTRVRRPFRVLLVVVAVWVALRASLGDGDLREGLDHLLHVLTIIAAAWLITALAIFFEDLGLSRYRIDVADNRVARRVRTQVLIIRRLTVVAIVVVAVGAILLTFPGAQTAGASVLASAGLVSIVAGLAAQSTLANVFAGMQLAFSDAIRVDDVVIVETEWGRVEEITLTYVVVHIWDDRRMVLPSTYFTTTPFQNWTRTKSELLGAVELDLDWRATPASMRAELERILAHTDLWDGRVQVLQVTDAVGGYVRIRVLVSAVDAPTLFDLRCLVREGLVTFLHEHSPQSLPRTRVQMVGDSEVGDAGPAGAPRAEPEPTGLFSGTREADSRASQFTGPISTVPAAERIDLEPDTDRWRTRD